MRRLDSLQADAVRLRHPVVVVSRIVVQYLGSFAGEIFIHAIIVGCILSHAGIFPEPAAGLWLLCLVGFLVHDFLEFGFNYEQASVAKGSLFGISEWQ